MERSSEGMDSTSGTPVGLTRVISILDRVNPIVRGLNYVGGGFLFLFVCFMFLDVLLRYLFNRPIPASVDITGMVMVLLIFLGVAYVQLEKGHITIDLITRRLRPGAALALSTAIYIICLVIAGVLIWRGVLNTMAYYRIGVIGDSGMPLFPSAALVPFGCIFLFVVFLRDILSKIAECLKLHLGVATWLLMLGLPVLWIVLTVLWMQPMLTGINLTIVGVLFIFVLFVLIFLGMPLAFALIMVAIVLMGYAFGVEPGFMTAGPTLYTHATTYNWCVIPLFIFMAYFIMAAGLGTDAFFGAYRWIGHFRGGLGMAVVGGSTALAAVTGAGIASTVTMGLVAYPEMRRYKYADSLATGTIAAGATLGPMIPPSIAFIVYGIITRESIGRLFIAGIIPGLMLAASFVAVILISCRINPKLGPPGERASWSDRLRSVPGFGPILALFIIIIGGIYAGVFSAMEGGGIGAFMALVIGLASRRLTWQKFKTALVDSMKFTSMLLLIIICASAFGNSLAGSGMSMRLVEATQGLGLTPVAFVAIILFIYLLFGIISDAPVILLLTLPILVPILQGMSIDLIWFGVLSVLIVNLGMITPPFAMGIFMLRSVAAPDISLGTMFRGIIPFCLSSLAVALLILFFPPLATWLPGLMR